MTKNNALLTEDDKYIFLGGIVHIITAFVLFTVEGFGYRIIAMINFFLGSASTGIVYYKYLINKKHKGDKE